MNNNDVLEAIDKLPGGEIMWYGPAPSWTATPRLTTRALKSLRQRVLDLEAENAKLRDEIEMPADGGRNLIESLLASNAKQQQAIAVLMEVVDHYGGEDRWFQSDKAEGCGIDYKETYALIGNGYDFAQSKKAEAEKILGGDDE
jgi:hypothetical protein